MSAFGRWLCARNLHAWRVVSISNPRRMSSTIGMLAEDVYRRLDACQRDCGASRHDYHARPRWWGVRVYRGRPPATSDDAPEVSR